MTDPWVLLKACTPADALRIVLPPRWEMQPLGFFMQTDRAAPQPARKLGSTYRLQLIEESGVTVARVLSLPERSQAAIGRMVRVVDAGVYDRIVVEPEHRRRGLSGVIMDALGQEAAATGARQGLLVATADGKALYESLGWKVLSPYATAVIPGD